MYTRLYRCVQLAYKSDSRSRDRAHCYLARNWRRSIVARFTLFIRVVLINLRLRWTSVPNYECTYFGLKMFHSSEHTSPVIVTLYRRMTIRLIATQSAIALSHEGKRYVERVVHCCKTRVEERLSLKNLIGGWVSSRGLVSDKKIPLWKMIYRRYSLFLTWECVFPRLPRITVSPYGLRLFAIVSFRVVVESWLLRIRRKNDLL